MGVKQVEARIWAIVPWITEEQTQKRANLLKLCEEYGKAKIVMRNSRDRNKAKQMARLKENG